MTPEEKLNHLRDWIADWIIFRVNERLRINGIMRNFHENGILAFEQREFMFRLPTFEQYLQIQQQ